MRPFPPLKSLACATFLLTAFSPPLARGEAADSGQIIIHADTLTHDAPSETFHAEGNVEIIGRGLTLLADKAFYRDSDGEAGASGHVIVKKGGGLLRGDTLKLNVETETGEVDNGRLFMQKGNFHLLGRTLYKTGPDDYRVARGSFTTCDGDSPSWKFTASDLQVTVGEYATGRNAVFYIKDVPVLYTPYIAFPVMRERQSGLLTPRIGNSTKTGWNLTMPYYWAISPSQDATFELDIQSKRGVGTAVDYRYIRRQGSDGQFRGYLIYDADQQRFRGDMVQRHQEIFSNSLVLKSDISLVTDRDFYRDYAEASGDYNRQLLESTVFLTKYWQKYVFNSELRYVEDLNAANNRQTMQKLPILSLAGIRQRIGPTPLFFSVDANFTNFHRDEGVRGQRFDLRPQLTNYFSPLQGLDINSWIGYRLRLYNSYGSDDGRGYQGVGLPDAGITVSSPLSRVYDTGSSSGLTRVRHVMVPEVGYVYVYRRDQEDLPFYDYSDRVVGMNMISYSLTNYLAGRYEGDGPAVYRDLAYLKISQGYEFGDSRRDLLTLVDEGRPFTDIRVESKIYPVKQLSLSVDGRFNPYRQHFSTASVGADLADGRGNSVGGSYRFVRGEVQYLEGRVGLALVKPFVLNYTGRYSFDRKSFLESSYSLEYRHQCWSVIFSYRDRLDIREFLVNFTLSGVGAMEKIRVF